MELNIDMSFSNYPSAVYAVTLALTLTLLISLITSDSEDIGVSGATVDETTLKQTAKAYVKVREIVQTGQQAIDGTNDNVEKQNIANR
jgi:hypothetical protein